MYIWKIYETIFFLFKELHIKIRIKLLSLVSNGEKRKKGKLLYFNSGFRISNYIALNFTVMSLHAERT